MKYFAAFIVLFAVVSFAGSENVVEVAKKEKLRRETLAREGKKSRTFTNEDIANLKSSLAMESTPASDAGEADTIVSRQQARPADQAQNREREEKIKRYKVEIEKVRKEIEEDRQSAGAGGIYHSRNIGTQYQTLRESEELLKGLEEDLAELEKKED